MGFLFFILAVVPLAEIYVLLKVGALLGFWPTVGFTILTAALGTSLARVQAARVWAEFQTNLQKFESPKQSVLEGLMVLVGGVLLLTPGFLTDAMGFSLLLPWTRRALSVPARRRVDRYIQRGRVTGQHPFSSERPDVVDTTADPIDDEYGRLN